jgi:hypothetical protein
MNENQGRNLENDEQTPHALVNTMGTHVELVWTRPGEELTNEILAPANDIFRRLNLEADLVSPALPIHIRVAMSQKPIEY